MSSSSTDTNSETHNRRRRRVNRLTKCQRQLLFKKYFDGDRYDTESFDDEVPLKSPHRQLVSPYSAPLPAPFSNFTLTLRDQEEEDKYQKRREFEFGPNPMDGHWQVPLEDSYFFDRFLRDYLGGPIKRWKPITSSRDKIEIEPLETDVLPPLKPWKPILFEIESPSGKLVKVQRICGYREIMEKRASVEKLKWIEASNRVDRSGPSGKIVRKRIQSKCIEVSVLRSGSKQNQTMKREGHNSVAETVAELRRDSGISTVSLSSVISAEGKSAQAESTTSSTSISSSARFFSALRFLNSYHPILVGGGDKSGDKKPKGKETKKPVPPSAPASLPPPAPAPPSSKAVDPPKPKTADPTKPKAADPPKPNAGDPPKPKAADPTKPKATDPTKPKAADPTKPKAADPTKSKAADPTKPKAADPTKPKAADPTKSKAADPKKPESASISSVQTILPAKADKPEERPSEMSIEEGDGSTSPGPSPTDASGDIDDDDDEGLSSVVKYEDTKNAYDVDIDHDTDHEEEEDRMMDHAEDANEKDNEWLQLSSSESEQTFFQYETVTKPKKSWMHQETSYESQNFARSLKPFKILLALFCRLPFFNRADTDVGLHLFSTSRIFGIPFRFTSTMLWLVFVVTAQSIIDSIYGSEDQEFRTLESLELQKFKVAIMGIFGNLCFVAICSMAFMLKDSFNVCQYMNYMTASISKMEISATRRIGRTVIFNMVLTSAYCAIMLVGFVYDTPRTVRGASAFFLELVLRPFKFRIRQYYIGKNAIYFEIFGMALHLFCYISLRFIFTHMHMLTVVIGNMAKNWNFRFGLTFAQFGTRQRAHAFRMHMGQSLIKLFAHHRLISGLTQFFGSVFAIPIITYYIVQIALVSYVLIIFFFETYTTAAIVELPIPGTNLTVTSNTNFDNVVTSAFVLAHFIFEFVLVSEVLSEACSPVMCGFEFVRRNGLLRCKNTHELRLVTSLQWSMSEKNPALLNVDNFFFVNRPGVLASLGFSIVIVSLVIQLKQTTLAALILECSENFILTQDYDWSSCHVVRLVASNEATRVLHENKELIERHKQELGNKSSMPI